MSNDTNHFNLERFIPPQDEAMSAVAEELRAGHKQTHWMWFVFPQLRGLGRSRTAEFFAIKDKVEAFAYLQHTTLGVRLLQHTSLVNRVQEHSAKDIFGHVDSLKFRSCMTLFASLTDEDSLFQQALDKYFEGEADEKTLKLLQQHESG
jgi:uncharacterized protein (DUF1810 family)